MIGRRFNKTREGVRTLTLGDAGGHRVEIAGTGWTLCAPDPTGRPRIAQDHGAEAMALPERTETSRRSELLLALGEALNVEGLDAVLAITWLAAVLAQVKAIPMLALAGQTACGSTSFLRAAHCLIDPQHSAAPSLPITPQELRRPGWSCRLATYEERVPMKPSIAGGLLAILDDMWRPVALRCFAGHSACSVPPDRRLDIHQRSIEARERLTVKELDIVLSNIAPNALGLLLDLAVEGLARASETRPDALPRSADFYAFGVAAETLLGPAGTFAEAWAAMEARRQDAEAPDGRQSAPGRGRAP